MTLLEARSAFMLDLVLLRNIDLLRISWRKMHGNIIREALQMYFRVHHPVSIEDVFSHNP
jgi:hypothetical protein